MACPGHELHGQLLILLLAFPNNFFPLPISRVLRNQTYSSRSVCFFHQFKVPVYLLVCLTTQRTSTLIVGVHRPFARVLYLPFIISVFLVIILLTADRTLASGIAANISISVYTYHASPNTCLPLTKEVRILFL